MRHAEEKFVKEIEALRRIGSQMSNICYNLRQRKALTDQDRDTMGELVREWDAIPRSVAIVRNMR